MSTIQKEKFQFFFNGVQYDATDYAQMHLSGINFLQNMKAVPKDFTEYFRALHSDAAAKLLKYFPIISVGKPSEPSQEYMEIYKKVEMLFQPLWSIEILLMLLVCSTWIIGCTNDYRQLSDYILDWLFCCPQQEYCLSITCTICLPVFRNKTRIFSISINYISFLSCTLSFHLGMTSLYCLVVLTVAQMDIRCSLLRHSQLKLCIF